MATSTSLRSFRVHKSFSDQLLNAYDGFILDQYGVLHDGVKPLPGAIDCIQTLVDHKKKLVILSNTGSPSKSAVQKLSKLGFDPSNFMGGAVTSGQECCKYIRQHFYGQKAVLLTWKDTSKALDFMAANSGSNITLVTSPSEADVVILHGNQIIYNGHNDDDSGSVSVGSYMETGDLETMEPFLQQCLKQKLPMLCANRDYVVKLPNGTTGYMPGGVADRYVEMGGACHYFGKPNPGIFRSCLDALNLSHHKVAHVGDSLHHDVAGANAAGIDSIFVLTAGVHSAEITAPVLDSTEGEQQLQQLFEKHGETPTHVVPLFQL